MSNAVSARLIAVSGPLRGNVYPVGGGELTIGRQESNRVTVPDLAVSRQHGVIRRDGDRYTLVDLGSRNGCFLNSVPAKERDLRDGDRIGIGESQFVFRTSDLEPEPEAPGTVEFEELENLEGRTVRLRREDAVYLRPEGLLADGPATARQVHDLEILLRVSHVVSLGASSATLAARLLDFILDVVPADRGAILLDSSGGEFDTAVGFDRWGGRRAPVHVSRTLVQRVLSERAAMLCNDIPHHELLSKAESLVASLVSAVLVVPIPGQSGPVGAVYLAMLGPVGRFEEPDLQLVTGIAGIAAAAFENARRMEGLEIENRLLQSEREVEHRMIGNSAPMERVYQFIGRAARENSTVLILGESGTGKELVARALHSNSPRASKPFVAVNCAALVDALLESELFGHEKGAFTGAESTTKGKIEAAHGGTLFLDEIAEMSPKLQAKLLRVLEEREVERVGGTRPRKVDVRVIAATHRNLEEEIQHGKFRPDLYFRLNVVAVRTPTLRERREDIIPLANFFVAKHCRQAKRRAKAVSPEARSRLMQYDWPGNVRELSNAIERAVVLGSGEVILPDDLPEALAEAAPLGTSSGAFHEAVRQAKKDAILKTLARTGGNYGEAAKALGIHVNYLHRVIRTLGIKAAARPPSNPSETDP